MKTLLAIFLILFASASHACFGARLKVCVEEGRELSAYSAGYFIEEKTGIGPEFVECKKPEEELKAKDIDFYLARADQKTPEGVLTRPAGNLPGLGETTIWLRSDIVEDLRFFTVDKSLELLRRFYESKYYKAALDSGEAPKKAARKAVNDGA